MNIKRIKNLLLTAAVSSVAITPLVADETAETVNLVSNPGFEEWEAISWKANPARTPKIADKQVPADWRVGQHAYEKGLKVDGAISKDDKVKRNGTASIRIDNKNTTDITEVLRWNLNVNPETTYKVKAWVKGENIKLNKKNAPGPALWGAAGPRKGFWGNKKGASKFLKQEGSFDWTPIELSFTTRPGDRQMIINLQLRRASGTLWVDDVEVVEAKNNK